MGLIYTRSVPVQLWSERLFPMRNERRISQNGWDYVENKLLNKYPFENKIKKKIGIIKKCSTLIRQRP